MLQCAGGLARIHRVLPSLVCQQARSKLEGSSGSDSSAVGALLSLEMCSRGTLRNDPLPKWSLVNIWCLNHQWPVLSHLVFSRKAVECILSFVVKMLLKPSLLLLFHCGLCFLIHNFMQILLQLPTMLCQSINFLSYLTHMLTHMCHHSK